MPRSTSRHRRTRLRTAALLTSAAAGLPALLAGCGGSGDEPEASKVAVAAAFAPLAEAAQRVGGDRVRVTNLTPVGGQPHDLQPSVEGLAALRRAKVVLTLGPSFQPAVTEAVTALPPAVVRADLLGGTDLLDPAKPIAGSRGTTGSSSTTGDDQHGWVAPGRFATMVDGVRDSLVKADPAGRQGYEQRAAAYGKELRDLDAQFGTALATCRSKVILTTHPAFAYLADAYGLRQATVGGLSPAARPTPASLAATKAYAKANDITTLFFGAPVPARLATRIEASAGVQVAVLNPVEGLTQDQVDRRESYLSIMRANLRVLVEGLGCTPGT